MSVDQNPPAGVGPKFQAALDFIGHTGALTVDVRYSDDQEPIVWFLVAEYPEGRYEVAASLDPERAALRLCERLADGRMCAHCGRPTGFDPNWEQEMPFSAHICWYQWDPELEKFRRSCEGGA